jgi:DNA adenine methylase
MNSVSRPVLRYHGGKWMLAPWIISYFPRHKVYTEVFGGGASVLLRKPRSYAEVYNDLDGDVVNVFRTLRDPDAGALLKRSLYLTTFARDEFFDCYAPAADDAVDRARCMIARSFMGFGSDGFNIARRTGFRANSNRSGTTPAMDWSNYPAAIEAFIERLRGVVIENRDACEVLAQQDAPNALHYVDPPYVHSTRSASSDHAYPHEMDDADHVRLAGVLRGLSGMVVLSGYRSEIYDELYGDWVRYDRAALADGALDRTESIWLSPTCVAATSHGPLFGGVA